MNDMSPVIIPKSDQISADDLLAGPVTIRITGVEIRPGTEQPVSISFENDEGRPWKPCKSMSRVLVSAWGPDAKAYAGRSVTLYRDPKVKWGGMEVGGIRVSHMSDIERDLVMALTATKGKKAAYTVKALAAPRSAPQAPAQAAASTLTLDQRADAYEKRLKEAASAIKLASTHKAAGQLLADLDAGDPERKVELEQLFEEREAELANTNQDDER